jgi:hypothetical protein
MSSGWLYATEFAVGVMLGTFGGMAHDGCGPYVRLGQWLDERARRKTLRLLNRIAYFAWDQAEDLTP